MKESIFKNNNQINSTLTTRKRVLLTEWTWYEWKNDGVPHFLNTRCCSSECSSVVLYEQRWRRWVQSHLAFRRDAINAAFLKYSKEDRSSLRHVGNWNVPSNDCYDDTKHYLVPSEKPSSCKVCKKSSQHHCSIILKFVLLFLFGFSLWVTSFCYSN